MTKPVPMDEEPSIFDEIDQEAEEQSIREADAQRMAARLINAGLSLTEHSERGRAGSLGTRELVIVRPYLIRYRIEGGLVVIVGVRHGARRPDFGSVEEEPSIFDEIDDAAERLADERAEADVRAGRVVPHETVVEWLKTWGEPNGQPSPRS